MSSKPVLYTYFRSSSAARVRIALNYKGIDFESRPVNLVKGEHLAEEYARQNPASLVPLIVIDGHTLAQSVAILEYLEETRPDKPLLPRDPAARAQVRAIVGAICSDTQPLQNLRVLKTLPEDQRATHAHNVIARGLAVVEKMLEASAGTFCVGDEVSMADCCLIPQVMNARRFGVDLSRYPHIQAIDGRASALEAFQKAHWTQQPDCPAELL
ncbi:Glutathione S-transferase zeta-1 [Coemansia nantahalensis]|uniref:Glutathione S-transferase zeta-1 n=2 Tax=Coemansia TaxID=4863 RepID=A0ACC1LAN4_9FUNG|nr:Glutathione S-transferase zeta-1 [Coemansia nantahalensis]KAJ2768256.1 Glutathione S-transferase zeta-1 [Coemansia nantahalensis]KAJ2804368.1 Glutathione S-transferase zeta-1 [Coemansia helicoidea]